MQTISERRVKKEEIDNMGHVNNTVYLTYLEEARASWYNKAGISFKEMARRNMGTVILRIDILYLKEAILGDELKIITQPARFGNKSFVFKQDIYNQNKEHITEATITTVMFDTNLRKSIKVVEEIARNFMDNIENSR